MDWPLTTDLCGAPFANVPDEDEDLTLGFSLLRALAESDHILVEIAPGVWRHSAEGVTYTHKD
jgi:hypothetical protein